MSDNTNMVERPDRPMISAEDVNPMSMMFDPVISDRVLAIAKTLAAGHVTVPEHLRGNVGDCLAIVMQAASWRLNPFAVAQKTHLVGGRLGYEAQLLNAIATSLRVIEGRFTYEYVGNWKKIAKKPKTAKSAKGYDIPAPGWNDADEEGLSVIVTAMIRGEQQTRSHELSLVQAWPRNSALWPTNPQQQISYLAVKQWMRKFAPDAILGIYTTDELEERVVDADYSVRVEPRAATIRGVGAIAAQARAMAVKPQDQAQPDHHNMAQEHAEAEQAQAAPALATWPKAHPIHGTLYDARGVPWIETCHSLGKTCNQNGSWRTKKGVGPDAVKWAEANCLAINLAELEAPPAEGAPPATDRDERGDQIVYCAMPAEDFMATSPNVDSGGSMADAIGWLNESVNVDELNESMDATRELDLTDEQRSELNARYEELLDWFQA